MSYARRTIGFAVEGIGSDTASSEGIAWCYGVVPTGTDYEWQPLLTGVPDTITDEVDVWTGQVKTSPINVTVAAKDIAATLLLYQQARTTITLSTTLDVGTVVFVLSDATLANTVIWIGNEAILLGNYSAGFYAATRGYWGTIAETHISGSYVYTKNPFLRYRAYRLLMHDHETGVTSVIQRGYIDQIRTGNNGTTIEIACQELLSLLVGAEINRSAPKLTVTGTVIPDVFSPQVLLSGEDNTLAMTSRVWRDDSSAKPVWLQIGGTVAVGSILNGAMGLTAVGKYLHSDAPDIEYEEGFSGSAYELFVCVTSSFSGANALASSGGLGVLNFRNAVALAYSFLRAGYASSDSGFDQWKGEWGVGLPSAYFDTTSIETLITNSDEDVVQQLWLGWDGETVSVEDLVLNKLLRPRGKFLCQAQDGRITFGSIRILDIEEFAGAVQVTPIPKMLEWEVDLNGSFSAIAAEVGETPWSDPDTIVIESRTGQAQDVTRRALYDTRREIVYDYSTLYAGSERAGLTATLLGRLMQGVQAVPKIRVEVVEGQTFNLGDWVRINAPDIQSAWWVDATGARIAFDATQPQFTGLLVGRRHNIYRGTYTLTLLMMAYRQNSFIRWRAPSAVVVSYVAGGAGPEITVSANVFHAVDTDASKFSVGDVLDYYYADGEFVVGSTCVVLDITGNVITTTTSVVPTAGMILRLSDFANYGDGGEPVAGAGRAYAFIGNADIYG